jgi:tetratricopeptide (TPR) repeat protein
MSASRPIVSFGGDAVDVTDPVDQARVQLTLGQFGLAVDNLQSALHREPQSGRILNLLAVAYDKLGRSDLADRYFAESLQIDPKASVTLNNWGYSKLLRGDRAAALDMFQRAAAQNPDNPVVLANLALIEGTGSAAGGGAEAAAVQDSPAPFDAPANAPADAPARGHIQVLTATPSVFRQASGVQLLVTLEPVAPDSKAGLEPGGPGDLLTAQTDLPAQQTYLSAPTMRETAQASLAPADPDPSDLLFAPAGPALPTDGIALAMNDSRPEGDGPSIRLVSRRVSAAPSDIVADGPRLLLAMVPGSAFGRYPDGDEGTAR